MPDDIVKDKETLRPYRLWDAHEQKQLHGRWYRWLDNAHDAAVVLARSELKVGRTIEVLDVKRAKLLMTYTKRINGIVWKNERQLREEEKK